MLATTAPSWVLLNDDEVLPVVPTADWDRPVDALVTPTRFLLCRPESSGPKIV